MEEIDDIEFVRDTLSRSSWHMRTLKVVRHLDLPDWAIGAGFVRNAIWDRLHGFDQFTGLADIDVLYFDRTDLARRRENEIETTLASTLPDRPWSVRNQARMHVRNGDRPYRSTTDALSSWLETPTCVAVRLDSDQNITVIAPYGLVDLVGMRGAPTVRGREKLGQYRKRMRLKNWPQTWPKVVVEGLD